MQEAVHKWLREKPKTLLQGIRKLVDRRNKCVEKEGDYIEKKKVLFNPFFCVNKLEKKTRGRISFDFPSYMEEYIL